MNPGSLLGAADFEAALGLDAGQLDERSRALLAAAHLRFLPIDDAGQARLRLETAQHIAKGFTVVGEHRADIWRDAWQDQLERFEQSRYDVTALNPNFVSGSSILRWQGAYIQGLTEQYELIFLEILRDWLFRRFLTDVDHLYEFGSGSGFNVAAYAKLFPDTPITALDWAPAAVRIAQLLREQHRMKIDGRRFDFFSPDQTLKLGRSNGVITMCALEQIGERFSDFLAYLLANRPRRVVHMEPTLELYNPDLAHDRLAIDYHLQRKYLSGFLPALEKLQEAGTIRFVFKKRLRFGSRFHECFTLMVWEPL